MPLKINVGLSRKVTEDFNSKGYSLNIEAELPASLIDDANGLAEATNHVFQRKRPAEHIFQSVDGGVRMPA